MQRAMIMMLVLSLFGCGSSDELPMVDGLGDGQDPVAIGDVAGERFDALDAVVFVPGGQEPSDCQQGNIWLVLSGENIVCEGDGVRVGEPRLHILVPDRQAVFSTVADSECVLDGEEKFFAYVEGKETGTHDAVEGRVELEEVGPDVIRGSFELTRFEGDSGEVKLEARFSARRCL